MKDSLKNHLGIAGMLLFIGIVLIVAVFVVHIKEWKIESALRTSLSDRQTKLITLSEITDRNGADESIESIQSDCVRRKEYDSMLDSLSTLTKKSLLELQSISDACNGFYAERKALMVFRLQSEYENYLNDLKYLALLTEHDINKYHVDDWKQLIDLEQERSSLLTEQKDIQQLIINALIQGKAIQSQEIKKMVHDAEEIAQLLEVDDRKIDEKREFLSK